MDEQPTLLIIDDDERILRSLKVMFKSTHRVIITTEPHEFLRYLRDEIVDVAISDQTMPVILGTELLAKAKTISPNTVRVLLTGHIDTNVMERGLKAGEFQAYISKPWDYDCLKRVIEQATSQDLTSNS